MGVAFDETVAGKVFANCRHALGAQALHHGSGERCGRTGIAMEGTVTDNGGLTVVEIEDGRESKVNADLA